MFTWLSQRQSINIEQTLSVVRFWLYNAKFGRKKNKREQQHKHTHPTILLLCCKDTRVIYRSVREARMLSAKTIRYTNHFIITDIFLLIFRFRRRSIYSSHLNAASAEAQFTSCRSLCLHYVWHRETTANGEQRRNATIEWAICAIKLPFVFSRWYHFGIFEIVALCNITGKMVCPLHCLQSSTIADELTLSHFTAQTKPKRIEAKNNTKCTAHTRSRR